MSMGILLEDLSLWIAELQILNNINLEIDAGETLCFVGESGSGKSMTVLSMLGLTNFKPGISSGRLNVKSKSGKSETFELAGVKPDKILKFWNQNAALIFQNSRSALNPYKKVKDQFNLKRDEAEHWLEKVRIRNPREALKLYIHELSGGMAQRLQIAVALSQETPILVADEPTTGLDSYVQHQIVDLFQEIREMTDKTMIFITHDLDLVKELGDRISVLYRGESIEFLSKDELLDSSIPKHPYTLELLGARRRIYNIRRSSLDIEYRIGKRAEGKCVYYHRCPLVQKGSALENKCKNYSPQSYNLSQAHKVRCWEYFRV